MEIIDNPILYIADTENSLPDGKRFEQKGFDFQGLETAYLEDIYPESPITDGDANSWEAAQGQGIKDGGGNCGTIAHIVALAACKDQSATVESAIYPSIPSSKGCYCVRFADGLKYQWVVIDSRVPINERNRPKYCRPMKPEHGFWASLLEKACATIRGDSYLELTNHAQKDIAFPGWLPSVKTKVNSFAQAKKIIDAGGYAVFSFPDQVDDETGEVIKVPGIVTGHAFACVDAEIVVDKYGDSHNLIRIENPWGGGVDYQGPYSDKSDFWKEEDYWGRYLASTSSQSGGNWWMSWDELLGVKRTDYISFLEKIPTKERPHVIEAYATFPDEVAPIYLSVSEQASLRISVKWRHRNGSCHGRIICKDRAGQIIDKSSWGWWGRAFSYVLNVEAGDYRLYPSTRAMDTDTGLMQITVESDIDIEADF